MKNKIELDLTKSPHIYLYQGLFYVFSSISNLNKFKNKIEEYKLNETLRLKYKYGIQNINFDLFLTISFYKKVEKRGFLVTSEDRKISMQEDSLFYVSYQANDELHF